MTDKIFKPVAQLYAKDEGKFFEDFSKVFTKCVPPDASHPRDYDADFHLHV